jgi:hypothetical protein
LENLLKRDPLYAWKMLLVCKSLRNKKIMKNEYYWIIVAFLKLMYLHLSPPARYCTLDQSTLRIPLSLASKITKLHTINYLWDNIKKTVYPRQSEAFHVVGCNNLCDIPVPLP